MSRTKSEVPDWYAGKKGKCPECGAVTTVPEKAEPSREIELDEEVPTSLKRATPSPPSVPPPPPSPAPASARRDRLGKPFVAKPSLDPSIQRVYLVDADMPFWSMVRFMVKWALASIPATIRRAPSPVSRPCPAASFARSLPTRHAGMHRSDEVRLA
jgi:hypothetical protein